METNKEEALNWYISGSTGNWYNKKTHEEFKGMEETKHDFEKGSRWSDQIENVRKREGETKIEKKETRKGTKKKEQSRQLIINFDTKV